MNKLTYLSSINRIDMSSQKDFEMTREAIRGEFEGGKYLRDIGTGALSGAAGGAVVGGGVGAAPGAIAGAAFGLGSNVATDIWYATRSDEDKASWQAGDLQERMDKMGGLLSNKTKSPEIGKMLGEIGAQYKNYIDIAVQKNDDIDQKKIYEQNMFNPNTETYKSFKSQFSQRTSNKKFLRIVEAVDNSPAAMVGGTGASLVADQLLSKNNAGTTPQSLLMKKYWEGTLSTPEKAQIAEYFNKNPDVYQKTLKIFQDPIALEKQKAYWQTNALNPAVVGDDLVGQSASQLAKPGFWKNIGNGAKGLGAGLAVDLASNWIIDKIDMSMTGGEINMFRQELSDVGKIITEINRLTKNQEDVVYAGNMLWTNLKAIDRMLAKAEVGKIQEESKNNQQGAALPNQSVPVVSSHTSKFKRLG